MILRNTRRNDEDDKTKFSCLYILDSGGLIDTFFKQDSDIGSV